MEVPNQLTLVVLKNTIGYFFGFGGYFFIIAHKAEINLFLSMLHF